MGRWNCPILSGANLAKIPPVPQCNSIMGFRGGVERKENMGATGIIRRIDDLGRVALPKEIRRKAGIEVGSPVEVSITPDGIILKKYDTGQGLLDIVSDLREAVDGSAGGLEKEKVYSIRQNIDEMISLLK